MISQEQQANVAIYVRVSTTHQIDKDSLPMQRNDLITYAKLMLNTDKYTIFEDAGYSGKNTIRPQFQNMMKRMRENEFTHLLVWKIDRISRNLLDFATMYSELKNLGVVFVSKNEQFDTSTAMGEAMLKIILVFAELERNMTSERVTATMIARANSGLWNGGKIPFGYTYNVNTKEFDLDPKEAPVVKLIHNLYEENHSLLSVARELNGKGYRTRNGNEWSPVSLHIILHNLFYCGDYRYNVLKEGNRQKVKSKSEWVTIENHHKPIVDREQKKRIIAFLDSNAKLRKEQGLPNKARYTHIFSGIAHCEHCGKMYVSSISTANSNGWRYSKYLCPTKRKSKTACVGKSTSDLIIGEFVFNYVLNMLNSQKSKELIASPSQLQKYLLKGDAFCYIKDIEPDGLNDFYASIKTNNDKTMIYGKNSKIIPSKDDVEITKLQSNKKKIVRALDRLQKLYLYDDESMSEADFIIEKHKLVEEMDNIDEKIKILTTDDWQQSISDETLIKKASEFIITQRLSTRKYINYKKLAMSVDAEILRSFVNSIIDSIGVYNGKVQNIIFKNGLSHHFIFK